MNVAGQGRRGRAGAALGAVLALSSSANAQVSRATIVSSAALSGAFDEDSAVGVDRPRGLRELKLDRSSVPYVHLLASFAFGRGLRLSNPYRLSTQLGDSAESLSATATYADLGLGAALGDPNGLQYGLVTHISVATDGIPQEVLTPSVLGLYRMSGSWQLLVRAGAPIVLEPDANLGAELAAGGVWLIRAGVGVTAELIGSLFYGAGTETRVATVIPILSAQAGLWVDYEVLP